MILRISVAIAGALAVVLLGETPPVWADIYRFVDDNGVIHFTNTPTQSNFAFYSKERGGLKSLDKIIRHYSRKFGLEEALVHAVIKVESDYDPKAASSKGALGLMQLIPETARDMSVVNPFDIDENVRGGCRYLRELLNRFGEDLDLALAAYNAGPSAVLKYKTVPPYGETQNYIQKVKHYLSKYRQSKENYL